MGVLGQKNNYCVAHAQWKLEIRVGQSAINSKAHFSDIQVFRAPPWEKIYFGKKKQLTLDFRNFGLVGHVHHKVFFGLIIQLNLIAQLVEHPYSLRFKSLRVMQDIHKIVIFFIVWSA